jgi:probable phosphoglycerate mutase
MTMRLIVIRHAQSEANAEGRIQGHLDIPLSELGRRQSALLAARLATLGVDALYSSPLRRARETADVIAARLGLPIEDMLDLRERDVGELEGLNRAEVLARFPQYGQPGVDVTRIKIAGFEQDEELVRRVTATFRRIVTAHEGGTAAVITHGGVISTVCRWALDAPRVRPSPFAIENTAITIIDVRELGSDGAAPRAQLILLNDACHLDGLTDA